VRDVPPAEGLLDDHPIPAGGGQSSVLDGARSVGEHGWGDGEVEHSISLRTCVGGGGHISHPVTSD